MEVYKQCFLRELAKGKSPAHAAQVAGLARSTAYLFRSQDPEFARQWLEASAEGVERLEDEAHRRGVEGVKRPVFRGGKKVGEITHYSDVLLESLLKRAAAGGIWAAARFYDSGQRDDNVAGGCEEAP
jgi:hypothetical protein